jgi:hypothetical protein
MVAIGEATTPHPMAALETGKKDGAVGYPWAT